MLVLGAFSFLAAASPTLAAEPNASEIAALVADFDKLEKPTSKDAQNLIAALIKPGAVSVPALIQAMEEAAKRDSLATGLLSVALTRLQAVQATSMFVKILTTTANLAIKRNMLAALRSIGDSSAVPVLLSALQSPVPTEADAGLQEIQLDIREDTIVALRAIASRGNGATVLYGELLKILSTADENWKLEIARTLKDIKRRESEDALMMLLADQSKKVVYMAAAGLGTAGSLRCAPMLIRAVELPEENISAAACLSLGQLKSISAVPALIKVLKSKDKTVTANALTALSQITGKSFGNIERWQLWYEEEQKETLARLQSLEAQLREAAVEYRPMIIESMAELVFARDRMVLILQPLLDSPEAKVRAATVNALAQTNDPRVPRMLLQKLNDKSDEVAYGAWRALKFITGENAPMSMQAWQKILDKRG